MVAVRLVTVPAGSVLNLTSPRRDIVIFREWQGKRDWHDPIYEPLRDLMEKVYVEAFDRANGHYHRLEEDILRNGICSPVMLVSGRVQRRSPHEVPPEWRGRPDLLVSEYLGGSRLLVAERHGLDVPAIVNDFGNLFPNARQLSTVEEVATCFPRRRPGMVTLSENAGAYVNDMDYAHMPTGYSLTEQIMVREAVLREVRTAVAGWLMANDRP